MKICHKCGAICYLDEAANQHFCSNGLCGVVFDVDGNKPELDESFNLDRFNVEKEDKK